MPKLIISIILSLVSSHSISATLLNNGTDWTGINGISVKGKTYNATFFAGTYQQAIDSYGAASINYSDNFAQAASNALDIFFTTTAFRSHTFNGCAPTSNCYLSTTTDNHPLTAWAWDILSETVKYHPFHQHINQSYSNTTNVIWHEVAAVPLPAAFWFMASGLSLLLGFTRNN